MSGILRLIRRDIAHATRNTMAVIVLVGLVVIPSLFTWFNVIASWDPFANTTELKVAVANTDEGYQSDLIPLRINIGDQVVSALRGNEDFDWIVTDEDDAIDGTRSGEYYAAIVLPPEFSQDMLTFYADGGKRTDITYYTNEKKNALAPKITGQGADAVSADINHVFAQTLGEIAVNILADLSDYLNDPDTQVTFAQLESHVSEVASQLRAGATNASAFAALLGSSQTLVTSAGQLVDGTAGAFDTAASAAGQAVDSISGLKQSVASTSDAIAASLAASADSFTQVGETVQQVLGDAAADAESQAAVLADLSARVQTHIDALEDLEDVLVDQVRPLLPAAAQQQLDAVVDALEVALAHQQEVKDKLDAAQAAITSGNATAQDAAAEIAAAVDRAEASIDALSDSYTSTLQGDLDQLEATLSDALARIGVVGQDLGVTAGELTGTASAVAARLGAAQDVLEGLADQLGQVADTFDALGQALEEGRTAGDFSGLQEAIGADPETLAASLASPVGLDRQAVFPVETFGSAMAPLYSVLALWVGALLMSVTITVAVPRGVPAGHAELTANQRYFGRYGIFALVGLAQSTLLGVGNLVFVQVQAVHPWLYLLAGWVASLVFTFTIYTAVVAFGNAGKALGVLFLVVQISGAGAAYPLQLLPEWFQHVSRFLPATYAVEAYRAAIAGIYQADYFKALGMLLLFVLPVLVLGLYLRKPLVSFNQNLARALESTKLM